MAPAHAPDTWTAWRACKAAARKGLASGLVYESRPSARVFEAMIRRDFCTFDSQEGRAFGTKPVPADAALYAQCIRDAFKEELEEGAAPRATFEDVNALYAARGGRRVAPRTKTVIERAYVAGLMPARLAEAFAHLVNSRTDKLALVQPCEKGFSRRVSDGPIIPVTYQFGSNVHAQLPELAGEVPLGTWVRATAAYPEGDLPEHTQGLGGAAVVVTCVDFRHGRRARSKHGLFTEVLQYLDEARALVRRRHYFERA